VSSPFPTCMKYAICKLICLFVYTLLREVDVRAAEYIRILSVSVESRLYSTNIVLQTFFVMLFRAGVLEQFMRVRNRVGIRLSYRPARLFRLAELIPWN
jgi:hypothetical protein